MGNKVDFENAPENEYMKRLVKQALCKHDYAWDLLSETEERKIYLCTCHKRGKTSLRSEKVFQKIEKNKKGALDVWQYKQPTALYGSQT